MTIAAIQASPFADALRAGSKVTVIAEFKRRSPSAGALAPEESPVDVARQYAGAGAAAISVLTDAARFGGSLADLSAVSDVGLPTLRKDFLTKEGELDEARVVGAAAALLIVAHLNDARLARLLAHARATGIECLVEVHDATEARRALDAGATLVGINNRNLATLTTDLAVTERVARVLVPGITVVAESGLRTPKDVERMRDAGAHAVLVGEAFLRARGSARRELVAAFAGVPR